MIIGTAGHVDHGKTEIVKALTGKNTDRLGEELQRGISIVLGFAPLDLGGGLTAGLVDVPGHERFVKNMVSGATGVDLALIVVAADEGVMPQTVEHFEVLRLLGIDSAVIAITKTDLVDEETAGVVESEVSDLLEGTPLSEAPMVRTSSVTGEGIEALRALLRDRAEKAALSRKGSYFRLPVDRVFTSSGIGTIVTGTAWSGSVRKGDELVVEPGGWKVRVRDVQSFDRVMETGRAGMRTALALHGVKPGDIAPGVQVVTPGVSAMSAMLDVTIEISSMEGSGLVNRQRVRFHHAARETLARAVLLDSEELARGGRGLLQLRFERPVFAIGGDRFIIRQYSPMRVIGGGKVLDPAPAKSGRFRKKRTDFLEALRDGTGQQRLLALVTRSDVDGLPVGSEVRYGLDPLTFSGDQESMPDGILLVEGRLFDEAVVQRCRKKILAVLEKSAARDPLLWGVDREQLRNECGLSQGPLFGYLLDEGKKDGTLFFRDGKVRAGSGDIELSEEDRKAIGSLTRSLKDAGLRFLSWRDLESVGIKGEALKRYLHIMQSGGSVTKLAEDAFADPGAVEAMKARLADMLAGGKSITVGDFKEQFSLSRKYAVPLLEYLDRKKITVRAGDSRKGGPGLRESGKEGGG